MHVFSLAVLQELLVAFLQLKDIPEQQTLVASCHGIPSQVKMFEPSPSEHV